jgi:alkylation response protein AidB-like acyl-CoA dehydrogenase
MSFALDPTETEILETVGEVAAKRLPLSIEPGRSYREFYAEAGELGFFGLNVPESLGGLGLTDFHAGLVAYAFGRELVPGPWLEHLVAIGALSVDGVDGLDALLAGTTLSGELVSRPQGVVGGVEVSGDVEIAPTRVVADVDQWLFGFPDEARGFLLTTVDAGAAGASLVDETSVDLGWRTGLLTLAGARGTVVAEIGAERYREVALLAAGLAAMSEIGSSERVLQDTVAFAKDREQFGQPIGSFQAVKHRLADVYIEIEHARNLVFAALASDDHERERLVPMAKLLADEVYRTCSEASIQLHGGFGFTWECPAHLFMKNALRLRTYPNTGGAYRRAVRERLGLEPDDQTTARTEELV